MSGWRQQLEGALFEQPEGAIGIVVAQNFPDPQVIRTTLEEGIGRVAPDTVWIMREKAREKHAVTFAWRTLAAHDIEPLLAPLVPHWKDAERDLRATWRDAEMRATCERIIVFHDKSSNVTAEWIEYRDNHMSIAKIYVVERGKVKTKKYRKGRKPD